MIVGTCGKTGQNSFGAFYFVFQSSLNEPFFYDGEIAVSANGVWWLWGADVSS